MSVIISKFIFSEIINVKDPRLKSSEIIKKHFRLDPLCKALLFSVNKLLGQESFKMEDQVGVIVGSRDCLFNTQQKYINTLNQDQYGSHFIFRQTANNILSGIISLTFCCSGINMTVSDLEFPIIDATIIAKRALENYDSTAIIVGSCDYVDESKQNIGITTFMLIQSDDTCDYACINNIGKYNLSNMDYQIFLSTYSANEIEIFISNSFNKNETMVEHAFAKKENIKYCCLSGAENNIRTKMSEIVEKVVKQKIKCIIVLHSRNTPDEICLITLN